MTRKAMPWVVIDYCEGCGSCLASCKRGCLSLYETEDEGIFVPWIIDTDRCTGCGNCANSCILGGISMTSYVDDAVDRFHTYIKEKKLKTP
jgi:ferredoxin